MPQIKGKCKFNSNLRRKYPFLEETKIKGTVICKCCGAKIKIESGGNSDIVRHLKSKKHQNAAAADEDIAFYYRQKQNKNKTKSDSLTMEGVYVCI